MASIRNCGLFDRPNGSPEFEALNVLAGDDRERRFGELWARAPLVFASPA
jgi:hypothetical protein